MTPTASSSVSVLFLDLVGYSRETTGAQGRSAREAERSLALSPTYAAAKAAGRVRVFPEGDGVAALFEGELAAPARCATELRETLRSGPLKVRMGVHAGSAPSPGDEAGSEAVSLARRLMEAADTGQILLSESYARDLARFPLWDDKVGEAREVFAPDGGRMEAHALAEELGSEANACAVIVYKRLAEPDEEILAAVRDALQAQGHGVFYDRHLKIGVEWAKQIEKRIRLADWVIAIVSDVAASSEMIEQELEIALDERRRRGKPHVLPVRVGENRPVEGAIGALLNPLNFAVWGSPEDGPRVLREILATIQEPPTPPESLPLEPVGGAVPPDSPFYVPRPTDAEFIQALRRNESILLVKGPRQVGKTSLIGQGVSLANERGWRVATTDFQKLSAAQLASEDAFYRLLAHTLARAFKFKYDFAEEWIDVFGANMNMDGFVRALIEDSETPLVWFMDEADKLFGAPFASDFFGLVRSWHNSRATEPGGPWDRFTVVMGYATEAHLFIQDLNQSPFNVGRQLPLDDFGLSQVEELNRRYGSPLTSRAEIETLVSLIGGQPFLTRRALDVLARGVVDLPTLVATADRDDGPFGDHLKRILMSVSQLPEVIDALRASFNQPDLRDAPGYARLLAAGVVRQRTDGKPELRYELYRRYLEQRLRE